MKPHAHVAAMMSRPNASHRDERTLRRLKLKRTPPDW